MSATAIIPSLAQCEDKIRKGRETFIEVGTALCHIRDHRLYTERGFGSFQEYCEEVWDWGKSYVSRVIAAADIAKKLPIGNSVETESQARELSKVEPEKRAEVLERASAAGPVTAKSIRQAARVPAETASAPTEPPQVEAQESEPPRVTADEQWKAAPPSAEPRVTEYYGRLEALTKDALENATEKQLVSMSVYAGLIPKLIKEELAKRKKRK